MEKLGTNMKGMHEALCNVAQYASTVNHVYLLQRTSTHIKALHML